VYRHTQFGANLCTNACHAFACVARLCVVTLCTYYIRAGHEHALTPLKFAFRLGYAVVISKPTLFLGALWLPHQRDQVCGASSVVVVAYTRSTDSHTLRQCFKNCS
jgi:hypothetical protein